MRRSGRLAATPLSQPPSRWDPHGHKATYHGAAISERIGSWGAAPAYVTAAHPQALGAGYAPQGWVLVAGLSVQTLAQALVHHQLFWVGMRMGLHMRTQTTLAVHDKVLRLNSAAVSDFSVGKVGHSPPTIPHATAPLPGSHHDCCPHCPDVSRRGRCRWSTW